MSTDLVHHRGSMYPGSTFCRHPYDFEPSNVGFHPMKKFSQSLITRFDVSSADAY